MEVIENELVIFFDTDDTLVMWSEEFKQPHEGAIKFIDPNDNATVYLKPHKLHIDFLKKCKGRGYYVIVWSAGGYAWSNSVVKTLELEKYVDKVMSKPVKFCDDLHANEILGTRVYLPFKKD